MKIEHLLVPIVILFLAGNGCEEANLMLPGQGKLVTNLVVQGLPAPAYRATPFRSIDVSRQYAGEVTWTPNTARFFADTEYTATITLIAKEGWTFEGIKKNSFLVPGGKATNKANSGTITVVFPATEKTDDQTITLLTIPGVQSPETYMRISTDLIETEQYTAMVSWPDASTRLFGASCVYTAHISLLEKPGWTLQGLKQNSFSVPGATTTTYKEGTGDVLAEFPRTASTITISKIPAIPVAVGAIPPTTITETDQFTGTISWNPADAQFVKNIIYTATISLTAKDGWTLNGVPYNFFTVIGATATNAEDSGTVTVRFPWTSTYKDSVTATR